MIEYGWRCKEKNDERRGEKIAQEEDVVTVQEEYVEAIKRKKIDLTHKISKQREKNMI